jgi:hypothetical protein
MAIRASKAGMPIMVSEPVKRQLLSKAKVLLGPTLNTKACLDNVCLDREGLGMLYPLIT